MAYMRLGDLLIAAGAITDEQLQAALQAQKPAASAWATCSSTAASSPSASSSTRCKCSWAWTTST